MSEEKIDIILRFISYVIYINAALFVIGCTFLVATQLDLKSGSACNAESRYIKAIDSNE